MECTHRFQVDSQNKGTCSLCGEARQFPWHRADPVIVLNKGRTSTSRVSPKEEDMTSIRQRHKYYEENKDAIIADLLTLGRAATQKKWGIPPGGTITSLEDRWLTQEQRSTIPPKPRGRPKQQPHPSTNSTTSNGRLPPLPHFSDNWDPSVQLQWLQLYSELARRQTILATTP